MARSVSKFSVALVAAFGLAHAGSALAAEAVELAVSTGPATASPAAAPNLAPVTVMADNRQTNLQKTPTAILVMGIEGKSKRPANR